MLFRSIRGRLTLSATIKGSAHETGGIARVPRRPSVADFFCLGVGVERKIMNDRDFFYTQQNKHFVESWAASMSDTQGVLTG